MKGPAMRAFRRLPPRLRVVGIVGVVLPFAALALLARNLLTRLATSASPADSTRVQAIASSLVLLGLCCTVVVATYRTRLRPPGRGPFPLDSWQRQVRTLLVLAALPLCVLTWAVLIPLCTLAWAVLIRPTPPSFITVFLIQMLTAGLLGGVGFWGLVTHRAED
jgi:hypothetical protein